MSKPNVNLSFLENYKKKVPTQDRRWYDGDKAICHIVKVLKNFPSQVQTHVYDAIIHIAQKNFELKGLRSYGSEIIVGIQKARLKRRDYDQNEAFHKAMNYFAKVSEYHRAQLAVGASDLVKFTTTYFDSCKEYEQEPDMDEVKKINETYASFGEVRTKKYLKEVKNIFIKSYLLGRININTDKIKNLNSNLFSIRTLCNRFNKYTNQVHIFAQEA